MIDYLKKSRLGNIPADTLRVLYISSLTAFSQRDPVLLAALSISFTSHTLSHDFIWYPRNCPSLARIHWLFQMHQSAQSQVPAALLHFLTAFIWLLQLISGSTRFQSHLLRRPSIIHSCLWACLTLFLLLHSWQPKLVSSFKKNPLIYNLVGLNLPTQVHTEWFIKGKKPIFRLPERMWADLFQFVHLFVSRPQISVVLSSLEIPGMHTYFLTLSVSILKKFISLTCSFYYLTSIKTISTEVILQISFLYLNTPSILTCTTSLLLLI